MAIDHGLGQKYSPKTIKKEPNGEFTRNSIHYWSISSWPAGLNSRETGAEGDGMEPHPRGRIRPGGDEDHVQEAKMAGCAGPAAAAGLMVSCSLTVADG